MSKKVFGDIDLSVRMTNTKDGLMVKFSCKRCDMEFELSHPWQEVNLMLKNYEVSGVRLSADGNSWIVSVECTSCSQLNQYSIDVGELEDHAQREIARRQRILKSQQALRQPRRTVGRPAQPRRVRRVHRGR
jgi:hypothetical protein